MEKVIIGVPHEIQIATSEDMTDFEAKLHVYNGDGYGIEIDLKPSSGNKFILTVPKSLEDTLVSPTPVKYSLKVYFDNAVLTADSGKIKFVSPKGLKVEKGENDTKFSPSVGTEKEGVDEIKLDKFVEDSIKAVKRVDKKQKRPEVTQTEKSSLKTNMDKLDRFELSSDVNRADNAIKGVVGKDYYADMSSKDGAIKRLAELSDDNRRKRINEEILRNIRNVKRKKKKPV